jgi:hypothetical protein
MTYTFHEIEFLLSTINMTSAEQSWSSLKYFHQGYWANYTSVCANTSPEWMIETPRTTKIIPPQKHLINNKNRGLRHWRKKSAYGSLIFRTLSIDPRSILVMPYTSRYSIWPEDISHGLRDSVGSLMWVWSMQTTSEAGFLNKVCLRSLPFGWFANCRSRIDWDHWGQMDLVESRLHRTRS